MREERFIIKVLEMHYKQGMSQVEIGKKLNVSRTTVSRALTRARKEGYVQIKINYPEGSMTNIEAVLEEKYELKEAIVASDRDGVDIQDEVAFYASDYIFRVLKNHMTFALTRGVTLQKMVECMAKDVRLKFLKVDDVNVVPLMATTNVPVTAKKSYRLAYSNYLMEEVARLINGNGFQILAPQYVASGEVKQSFLKEDSVKEVMDMAKNADVAVMGIGTLDQNSAIVNANLIPVMEFERLKKNGGVGEILSHGIDKDGNVVKDEFEDRLISLELDELKKIPIRVGVACGAYKKEAILAALRGKIINVLITDDSVAEYLANIEE
ncbi:MAG: sugar-binding domain-containing protein [Anaerostipes sp.]|nr:sugar-binding domain-containing protein [Anaerostipes sp.]MDD3746656.1 sugar-binding domain-containing protein [Anaerostipes sp.]